MKRLLGLATVLVLATGTGARAECYPPNPNHGSGHVDRTRVAPGECVQFSGDGFQPKTTIAIADNGASRGTTRADKDGAFSTPVCFGSDTTPGQHTLTARGKGDNKGGNGNCGNGNGNGNVQAERTVDATVYVLGVSIVDPPKTGTEGRGETGGLPFTGDVTFAEGSLALLLLLVGTGSLVAARPRRRSSAA